MLLVMAAWVVLWLEYAFGLLGDEISGMGVKALTLATLVAIALLAVIGLVQIGKYLFRKQK
jgi:hypothetical protein